MAYKPSVSAVNLMIVLRSLAFDQEVELEMNTVQRFCISYDARGIDSTLELAMKEMEKALGILMRDIFDIMSNNSSLSLGSCLPLARRVNTVDFILKNTDRIRQEF
jgi:hypothetical protein